MGRREEERPAPADGAGARGGGTAPSRDGVAAMFNRIAHRYDLLNRSLSLGQDVRWRRRMIQHLPPGGKLRVLDLATGTADVLLFLEPSGRIAEGVGLDTAEAMLDHGRAKIARAGLAGRYTLAIGDAMAVPVPDAAFDVVTISFGIRNVRDTPTALREMWRVLKPGGRAVVLEFSLPPNAWLRRLYLFYFRHILPRIGGWLSGDAAAYGYLNRTVETYPHGDAFLDLMRAAGFAGLAREPLTFGIATLYHGDRPGGAAAL